MTPVVFKYTEEVSKKEFVLVKMEGIFSSTYNSVSRNWINNIQWSKQSFSKPRRDLVLSFTSADRDKQDSFVCCRYVAKLIANKQKSVINGERKNHGSQKTIVFYSAKKEKALSSQHPALVYPTVRCTRAIYHVSVRYQNKLKINFLNNGVSFSNFRLVFLFNVAFFLIRKKITILRLHNDERHFAPFYLQK